MKDMQYINLLALSLAIPNLVLAGPLVAMKAPEAPHVSQLKCDDQTAMDAAHPKILPENTASFLDKYQTHSTAVVMRARDIPESALDDFVCSGLCSVEHPCLSVLNVSAAAMPSDSGIVSPALTATQVSGLLDSIKAKDEIHLDNAFGKYPQYPKFGYMKKTINGATIMIMSPLFSLSSTLVVASAFDSFKASVGIKDNFNAVRAFQNPLQEGSKPTFMTCLYPEHSDKKFITNFCLGIDLDDANPSKETVKRQLLSDLIGGAVSIISDIFKRQSDDETHMANRGPFDTFCGGGSVSLMCDGSF